MDRKEKFTPGPWYIETVHVGDEKWDEIRDKDGNFISESGNYLDSDPEPHPDSVLQKAAPEMYEMLQKLSGTLASVPLLRTEIEKLLKKARGEE